METLKTLAFDADDTLWHNETFFQLTQARFEDLLAPHCDAANLYEVLVETERRNIGHYGYGIKGFVLSMIETALQVTDKKVPGHVIAEILSAGQEMLAHPIDLLPGVAEHIPKLAQDYHMLLITKGDLLDQERKIAQSGLGDHFDAVHIVSDKTRETYDGIFAQEPGGAQATMMIGNSMKSDILPALEAGAWACFAPQPLSWDLEHAEPPSDASKLRQIETMHDLPTVLESFA